MSGISTTWFLMAKKPSADDICNCNLIRKTFNIVGLQLASPVPNPIRLKIFASRVHCQEEAKPPVPLSTSSKNIGKTAGGCPNQMVGM
jgi:hypothetical protein